MHLQILTDSGFLHLTLLSCSVRGLLLPRASAEVVTRVKVTQQAAVRDRAVWSLLGSSHPSFFFLSAHTSDASETWMCHFCLLIICEKGELGLRVVRNSWFMQPVSQPIFFLHRKIRKGHLTCSLTLGRGGVILDGCLSSLEVSRKKETWEASFDSQSYVSFSCSNFNPLLTFVLSMTRINKSFVQKKHTTG